MLLSWHGKGWIGFVLLFGAVALGLAVGGAWKDTGGILAMGVGFIVAGILFRILGRRWNVDGPTHRFCEMRLERWIYVFIPIGMLLTFAGYQALKVS